MREIRFLVRLDRKGVIRILSGVLLILACRLPGNLLNTIRPAGATLPATATITPVRLMTETSGATQDIQATGAVTASAPAATITGDQPTFTTPGDPYIGPQIPEITEDIGTPVPSITPSNGNTPQPIESATQDLVYPFPQGPLQNTTYPGAATDIPVYNPYPDGETPTAPAPTLPAAYPGGATAASTLTAGTPTPTWTQVIISPTPTGATQPGPVSPTPASFSSTFTPTPTRTVYTPPTPTVTRTPTPTRTPLPAPPWVSAQISATDPNTVDLSAGKPQLIEFFAYWSGPSLAMAPLIQGVEQDYAGRVNFVYLDTDDPGTEPLQEALFFRSEPHFFLLDGDGKVLRQWLGYVSVEELRREIEEALR